MKNSLAILVALFVLGACSSTGNGSNTLGEVNSTWAELVGGKTAYGDTAKAVEVGEFSDDATTFTFQESNVLKIKSSTVNSAEYVGSGFSYKFTSVTSSGGTYAVGDFDGNPFYF